MRTSLVLSVVLLVVVVCGGIWCASLTKNVSDRYFSAAEELDILTGNGAWERSTEVIQAYMETWGQTENWLQIVCDHADIDAVSLALKRIAAGIQTQDQATCAQACWELRENARHIYHRDALTWGNVL